jgi:hypothetical protein
MSQAVVNRVPVVRGARDDRGGAARGERRRRTWANTPEDDGNRRSNSPIEPGAYRFARVAASLCGARVPDSSARADPYCQFSSPRRFVLQPHTGRLSQEMWPTMVPPNSTNARFALPVGQTITPINGTRKPAGQPMCDGRTPRHHSYAPRTFIRKRPGCGQTKSAPMTCGIPTAEVCQLPRFSR